MNRLIEQILEGEVFWYELAPAPRNQSAFVPYSDQPTSTQPGSGSGSLQTPSSAGQSMNKRMIEFLRNSVRPQPVSPESHQSGGDRCFRHMMNERLRRKKQKASYSALQSLLPAGTKSDKNSIVQSAVRRIQELQRLKEDLERRSNELEGNRAAIKGQAATRLRIRVPNPASGIDSFAAVLKCLKNSGSETKTVQAEFNDHEFLSTMDVQITDKIGAAEVENAVQRALDEVELKLPSPSPTCLTTSR